MLTITNSVTPDKLKDRFKPNPLFTPPNQAVDLKQHQLLKTKEQMTRRHNPAYVNQGTEIKKALIG
jgi:hypothetical protein